MKAGIRCSHSSDVAALEVKGKADFHKKQTWLVMVTCIGKPHQVCPFRAGVSLEGWGVYEHHNSCRALRELFNGHE